MAIYAKKPVISPLLTTPADTSAPTTGKEVQGKESHSKEAKGKKPASKNPAIDRAAKLIANGDYEAAAKLLHSAGREPQVRNALGVCLMRLGQTESAVQLFRQLVLMPGSVLERAEISPAYKRNFATALLMRGFPSGALEVLSSMGDSDSLFSARIRSAIKQWEKSLSWWRRLDWKLNRIEPSGCHVPIDFEPGELDFEVVTKRPDRPGSNDVHLAA